MKQNITIEAKILEMMRKFFWVERKITIEAKTLAKRPKIYNWSKNFLQLSEFSTIGAKDLEMKQNITIEAKILVTKQKTLQ